MAKKKAKQSIPKSYADVDRMMWEITSTNDGGRGFGIEFEQMEQLVLITQKVITKGTMDKRLTQFSPWPEYEVSQSMTSNGAGIMWYILEPHVEGTDILKTDAHGKQVPNRVLLPSIFGGMNNTSRTDHWQSWELRYALIQAAIMNAALAHVGSI
jgi:hypothetical protein